MRSIRDGDGDVRWLLVFWKSYTVCSTPKNPPTPHTPHTTHNTQTKNVNAYVRYKKFQNSSAPTCLVSRVGVVASIPSSGVTLTSSHR